MSDLTGLPASALARAAATANINAVAVRILLPLPGGMENNPKPVHLAGTVQGQNPDGSIQLKTERGVINILLKDRAALPVGQKIDIDIPAGRPPMHAAIRPPTSSEAAPSPQTQASAILTNAAASGVKLDRTTNLRSDDLAEAMSSISFEDIKPAAAPLAPGQILRLSPLPLPMTTGSDIDIVTPENLFNLLLQKIEEAVDIPVETKQNLVRILSQVDLPSLLAALPEENIPATKVAIVENFQKLVQAIELPETLKLRNASSQILPPVIFNPAKSIDVKILAFPETSFQTVMDNISKPLQMATPAIPVIDLKNFVVAPQPQNLPAALPALAPSSQSAILTPLVPDMPETAITFPPSSGAPINPMVNQAANPAVGSPLPNPAPQSPQTAAPLQPQVQAQASASPITTQPTLPTNPPQSTPSQPPALLGQVVSFTPMGQPVISLTLPGTSQPQSFVMQFVPNNLAAGAPVIVLPLPTVMPKTSFVPFALGNAVPLSEWSQPAVWESLQNLITTVGHYSPLLAQNIIHTLPNAAQPQNLGALATLFVAMLRNGQIDEWIGDSAANLLKQTGKIDILRALAGDGAMTTRLETATLPNEWRATIFPFWHDNQVHKLPLYYKNWHDDNEEQEERDRRKKTRFMFELKLSRMGQVQVDGFMSREKLDMILRTRSPVGVNMQESLRKLYHKAMERSNLSGEITFQFKPEQWVNVEIPYLATVSK